jgi:hypothetical protein
MSARLNKTNSFYRANSLLFLSALFGVAIFAVANYVHTPQRARTSPAERSAGSGTIIAKRGSVPLTLRPEFSSSSHQLPAAVASSISSALGSNDAHYSVRISGGRYSAENPVNHLNASFADEGISLQQRDTRWGMNLTGWGYDQNIQTSASVAPHAIANRIEYDRGNLTETYVNGPLGLEQSFHIAKAPWRNNTGQHTLALSFALKGNWKSTEGPRSHALTLLDDSGRPALHYAGLAVHDASGHELISWLEAQGQTMHLRVDAEGAEFPVTIDPTYSAIAQLSVSNAPANSLLGVSTAISDDGSVVVAGACGLDVSTGGCSTTMNGRAYVFVEPTGGWAAMTTQPTAILTASDDVSGTTGDGFGSAVAINAAGTMIAVSAPQHTCQTVNSALECKGEAYVFSVPASADWMSVGNPVILTASEGAIGDFFASSLAMDQAGDTIVAREFNSNTNIGHVNVYYRAGSAWASTNETAQLELSTPIPFDNFGFGLAISGDGKTVVVGSFAANSFEGEAYVFLEPTASGGWTSVSEPIIQSANLLNSDASANGGLGFSAAVDQKGDTIVIGAAYQNSAVGEAYIYVVPSGSGGWAADGNTFYETTRLEPDLSTFIGSGFAEGVSISDDGSTITAGSGGGGVLLFTEPTGGWPTGSPSPILDSSTNPVQLVPAITNETGDYLGMHGRVSGNTVASGATGTVLVAVPGNNSDAGTVFVYSTQTGPTYVFSATTGSGQSASTGAAFGFPLEVTVQDTNGNPPATPVTVTFNANAASGGASGTFANGTSTTTAPTNASGVATSTTFTANGTAGSYTVTATAPNVSGTATFSLTNTAAPVNTNTTFTATSSFHGQVLPTGTALVGNPITVNFSVQPVTGNGIPTGTVTVTDTQFLDTCSPSPAPLNASAQGSCTVTIAALPPGNATSFKAQYTSNANAFISSTSLSATEEVVEGIVPCSGAIPTVTVQQKATVTATFTVCLAGNLNLANVPLAVHVLECLPFAQCTITITPVANEPGVYTVSVKMITSDAGNGTASSPFIPTRRGPGPWSPVFLAFAALLAMLTAFLLMRRSGGRPRLVCCAGLILAFLLAGISGCNSGGSSSAGLTPLGAGVVNLNVVAGAFNANVAVSVMVTK